MSKGCQEWETPDEVMQLLFEQFSASFTLDVCATRESAKGKEFYTRKEDGLESPWYGTVWCNPPYSKIRPWVEKAIIQAYRYDVERIFMLLPANISSSQKGPSWFELAASHSRWFLFRNRIAFKPPEGVKASSPSISNALFVFDAKRGANGFGGWL